MGKINISKVFQKIISKKCGLGFVGIFMIFLIYSNSSQNVMKWSYCRNSSSSENSLNPPTLDESLKAYMMENYADKKYKLKYLSSIVNQQIKDLQSQQDCKKPNILCGHYNMCGFGCQIHHRAACLMISYAMGLPLIHETELAGAKWAYSTPWTDMLLPIGSGCNVTCSTYVWTWKHTKEFYSEKHRNSDFTWNLENFHLNPDNLDYPLFNGIVVSHELGKLVEAMHPDPYKWWVSQFVRFTLRVQEETTRKIEFSQKSIGLKSNCIGFHIRRTDKVDDSDYFHEIDKYFAKAEEFYNNKAEGNEKSKKPQIFIASDDASVLKSAIKKYKHEWDVIGFQANKTLTNEEERRGFLYEILRDTLTLVKCDVVVCGLSSNICNLIQEMQWGDEDSAKKKLISLDKPYSRYLIAGQLPPLINKV